MLDTPVVRVPQEGDVWGLHGVGLDGKMKAPRALIGGVAVTPKTGKVLEAYTPSSVTVYGRIEAIQAKPKVVRVPVAEMTREELLAALIALG